MTKSMIKTKNGKTLSDLQMDAVILHGLAQAADELDFLPAYEPEGKPSAARNALTAVNHVMERMSSRLADELDELDTEVKQ